jgi:hypothetical protein
MSGLCAGFGIVVRYLNQPDVESLARWILNPDLEYHRA